MHFDLLTPLYHQDLDAPGISEGSIVWHADGDFVPVEELKVGDHVLGVTYRLEPVYLPRGGRSEFNFATVLRPCLCTRKILGIKIHEARAWQMTFGDFRAEFKNRRLVAGADTYVRLFPLSHDTVVCRRMVDCHTAVANPRTEQLYRKAYALDPASSASGEPVYRPTEFTGQPRGDQAVLIPFDAYGGQTGMIDARIHDYPRYVYTQIREVVPLTARSVLYELDVQGDTRPEAGVPPGKSRKNYIAVTPWAPEVERVKVRVVPPDPSRLPEHLKTAEWEQWIKSLPEDKKAEKEIEVVRQGVYYETQKGEVQQQLANKYGITRGFVNGALLIQTPYE